MDALFFAVFAMSLTGSGLWLLLRLARPLTDRLCSARWEKFTRIFLLLAFLFPVGLLLRPLLAPVPVLTVPTVLSPYGTAVSLPPIWAWTSQDAKPGPPLLWPTFLALVWLAGALTAVFMLYIRQRRFMSNLKRTALPVEDLETLTLLASLCEALRLSPIPALYTSERVHTPLGAGLLRPALYLPELCLSQEELELILRHEITHLKRRDLWFKWVSLSVLVLHWFNPAAWAFVRECGLLCETACDEEVTMGLDKEGRRHYGCAILDTLYRSARPEDGVCSSFCDRPSGLELRLKRILCPRRGRLGQVYCSLLLTALLLSFLPLTSAVHAWVEPYRGWESFGDYQANMARTALEYLPYGVTYDANTDLFSYRGEPLSAFIDTVTPTKEQLEQFPDFTAIWKCGWYSMRTPTAPAYRAMRDEKQQLVGITPLSEEERAEFLKAGQNSVCFNGYFTSGDGAFYATDPAWDSLPQSVRDWALAVPDGAARAMADGTGGYLCYGGLYCPWTLRPSGDKLDVCFYTIEGSDPSRPCVIRYTAKTAPTDITFFVNDEPIAP